MKCLSHFLPLAHCDFLAFRCCLLHLRLVISVIVFTLHYCRCFYGCRFRLFSDSFPNARAGWMDLIMPPEKARVVGYKLKTASLFVAFSESMIMFTLMVIFMPSNAFSYRYQDIRSPRGMRQARADKRNAIENDFDAERK